MSRAFHALVHRVCGHLGAGPTQERRILEGQHKLLAAAGYYQWRVQTVELTEETILRLTICDTCRIDPQRGLLPAVVDVQRSDEDARDAAALGAHAAHVDLSAVRGDQ